MVNAAIAHSATTCPENTPKLARRMTTLRIPATIAEPRESRHPRSRALPAAAAGAADQPDQRRGDVAAEHPRDHRVEGRGPVGVLGRQRLDVGDADGRPALGSGGAVERLPPARRRSPGWQPRQRIADWLPRRRRRRPRDRLSARARRGGKRPDAHRAGRRAAGRAARRPPAGRRQRPAPGVAWDRGRRRRRRTRTQASTTARGRAPARRPSAWVRRSRSTFRLVIPDD